MSIPKDILKQLQELVDGQVQLGPNGKMVPTEARITITNLQAEALGGLEGVEATDDLGNAYLVPVKTLVELVRPEYCSDKSHNHDAPAEPVVDPVIVDKKKK